MEPTALQIDVQAAGSEARLVIVGEIDLATAPLLSEAFAQVIEGEPSRVVLDCAGLTFLDSSGIQVLVAAWEQLKDRATMPVVLTNVSPLVKQVLEACGVRSLLME